MAKTKLIITKELLESVQNKIEVLLQAIEADQNSGKQIAFRMLAATGTHDSKQGSKFQLIVELCTNEAYFMDENDIHIITEPQHLKEPYKICIPNDNT